MLGLSAPAAPGLDVESLHAADHRARWPSCASPPTRPAAPVRAVAPIVFNGRIDPPGDEDRFVLAVTAGQRLHVAVEASQLGSALDGVLQVQGAKGAVIANADDTTIEVPGQAAGQGGLVYPDPVARPDGSRRDGRDHAGPARPRGARRRRIPLPDRRHPDRSDASTLHPERGPGQHSQGRQRGAWE